MVSPCRHAGVCAAALLQVARLQRLHLGVAAIGGVDLCVSAGECVAVWGPNGVREVHAAAVGHRAGQPVLR